MNKILLIFLIIFGVVFVLAILNSLDKNSETTLEEDSSKIGESLLEEDVKITEYEEKIPGEEEDIEEPDEGETEEPKIKNPEELSFSHPGEFGMFDPSLEYDPNSGNLYMSYSSATKSNFQDADPALINIRLASSSNKGETWKDQTELFAAQEVLLPSGEAIWEYEVSSLVYDPSAPSNEKWKVFAMRYLKIDHTRLNEHSWISMKTSSSPSNGWSEEKKIFTGFLYDTVNDETLGPPKVKLNELHSDLSNCAAFTEPGALGKSDNLYLTLKCATGIGQDKIILLKLSNGQWTYINSILTDNEAESLGFNSFSAPDLVKVDNEDYIIVSPESGPLYDGCYVYQFNNIASANLDSAKTTELEDTGSNLNGACTYDENSDTGIIFFERFNPTDTPFIKMFKSFVKIS